MSEYLCPHRLTRRDFLRWAGATGVTAGLATRGAAETRAAAAPVTIGSGKHTYTLDPAWGQLPPGMQYGHGCAVVVEPAEAAEPAPVAA